jgi:hypothetical protein
MLLEQFKVGQAYAPVINPWGLCPTNTAATPSTIWSSILSADAAIKYRDVFGTAATDGTITDTIVDFCSATVAIVTAGNSQVLFYTAANSTLVTRAVLPML